MEKAIIQKQVQIVHPEKMLPYLPNINESTLAPLFGISVDEYKNIKAVFSNRVSQAVEKLLSEPDIQSQVNDLPFHQDDVILVLGESNTDDYQSWFEILKGIVVKMNPEKNIKMINAAISGQTTTVALRNLTANLQVKPTWIVCMLGMNDSLRIGGKDGKTLVSIEETKSNLDFIHALSKQVSNPRWIWITPYRVDEERQDENKWFAQLKLKWYNDDLSGIHMHLTSKKEIVVDLRKGFDGGDLLLDDGVHTSLEGHIYIVRQFLTTLSESRRNSVEN